MTDRILINAVSSKTGGGLTDLTGTLPRLRTVLAEQGLAVEIAVVDQGWQALQDCRYPMSDVFRVRAQTPARRALWELVGLPQRVRQRRYRVVFHFSNFIIRPLPVPQLTVFRTRSYFSALPSNKFGYRAVRQRLACHYTRRTLLHGDTVFCISETQQQAIISALGDIGRRTEICHLGFSQPILSGHRSRQQLWADLPPSLTERFSVPAADRPILLNIAHYYPHKNLLTLLDAVERLAGRWPTLLLILTAGIMDDRHRPEYRLARSLTERGILCDLGPVPQTVTGTLYGLADLFVFPSALESFAHPLLEASAAGVPVIASDTPIHREICADSVLYHPLYDAAALAEMIDRVLHHECLTDGLITKARMNCRRFNWNQHAERLGQAITRLAYN